MAEYRQATLHPARQTATTAVAASAPLALTTDAFDVIKDLLSYIPHSVTSTPSQRTSSIEHGAQSSVNGDVPTTPYRLSVESLPPRPTPTKLPRLLKYAEEQLGVELATSYEFQMKTNGYGLDILHLVDDAKLVGIGLSDGDVIRLKRRAPVWYGSALHQKCSRMENDTGESHVESV